MGPGHSPGKPRRFAIRLSCPTGSKVCCGPFHAGLVPQGAALSFFPSAFQAREFPNTIIARIETPLSEVTFIARYLSNFSLGSFIA